MCIGILKTKNGKISKEKLKKAYNANPDGCGLLSIVSKNNSIYDDGFLVYRKGVYDWNRFEEEYNLFRYDGELIIHFRTASAAGIGYEFCHPHFVNDGLAFVHNGNFFEFSSYFKGRKKDNKTDTIRFNEEILQKLPDNFLDNKEILSVLELYCKNNLSKMILMNNEGRTLIINEDAGEWIDGCWYSNKGMNNYSGYGYSGAYYYHQNDIRHKGGLTTVQMFSESRRNLWCQCECCGGWYYLTDWKFCGLCNACKIYQRLKGFCR